MIPKIIHYCWFGRKEKPKLAEKCIKSWKKKCPEYHIIEWNEDNFDITNCPMYVQQAYEAKKWAFVTDYVRLKVVYDYGGIYLDTDVELIKKLDSLLKYDAFFGFEDDKFIATGLGFGAMKGTSLLNKMMADYADISFILENGQYDETPCPMRNTKCFMDAGFQINGRTQILGNVCIFSKEYFCPISFETGKKYITENTVSIHWFSASWKTPEQLKIHRQRIKQEKWEKNIDIFIHIPNRALKRLLGAQRYERLKYWIQH